MKDLLINLDRSRTSGVEDNVEEHEDDDDEMRMTSRRRWNSEREGDGGLSLYPFSEY